MPSFRESFVPAHTCSQSLPLSPVLAARLARLLDKNSFSPLCGRTGTEVVGGTGLIDGRRVCVIAVCPDAPAPADPADELLHEFALLELAGREMIPVILLADRPHRVARERTAIPSHLLATFAGPCGAGRIFSAFARLSGVVPRIALVFSSLSTTLAFPPAECDTLVMLNDSALSLGRPDMIRLFLGEKDDPSDPCGSARMHAGTAGTCDRLAMSEEEAISWVRKYTGFFPQSYAALPPLYPAVPPAPVDPPLVFPQENTQPFDIHRIISAFTDAGSFLELREAFAPELVTGLARVEGMAVGIIANNADQKGGILFPESCKKLAAFASLCDAFNIPIVFLADTPGFIFGRSAEENAIIQYASLVFSVIANLEVPHLTVVVRKIHTAGYYAMGGPGFDPERIVALEDAEISIYGRKVLGQLARDQGLPANRAATLLSSIRKSAGPGYLAGLGYVDLVIPADSIRPEVAAFLRNAYRALPRTAPGRVLCI